MVKNRVLVIGLDGATFDVIGPYVEKGELPTFKRLMDNGAWGRLRSVPGKKHFYYKAIQSATAWASIMTGCKPEKHGIWWFTKNGRLHTSRDIKCKKIWNILDEHGKRSIVINIPMTYPVEKINGYMISSFLTPPNRQFTYPKSLEKRLENYTVGLGYEEFIKEFPRIDYRGLMDRLLEILEQRKKVLLMLMKKDWDFATINFKTMDDVLHLFWHFNDPEHVQYDEELVKKYGNLVLEYHKHVDSVLEQVLERIKNSTTTFIISDHGLKSKFREKTLFKKLVRIFSILIRKTKVNHITGNHDPEGIFIAYGRNIKRKKLEKLSILDLAPTILYILNIPIPKYMDGRVLKEIFKPISEPGSRRV